MSEIKRKHSILLHENKSASYLTIAWPDNAILWQNLIQDAQREALYFLHCLMDVHKRLSQYTVITIFVSKKSSREYLIANGVNQDLIHFVLYDDIWIRDTTPLLFYNDELLYQSFVFNGWGDKFFLVYDMSLSSRLTDVLLYKNVFIPCFLEGGAIESNGEGVLMMTESCILSSHRSFYRKSKEDFTSFIKKYMNVKHIIWFEQGLQHDDTDGHIDNIARFADQKRIISSFSIDNDDPNRQCYESINKSLYNDVWIQKENISLNFFPAPVVRDQNNQIMCASYMNYCLFGDTIFVPVYDCMHSQEWALLLFQEIFTSFRVVAIPSYFLLHGGGSVHCMTQNGLRFSP